MEILNPTRYQLLKQRDLRGFLLIKYHLVHFFASVLYHRCLSNYEGPDHIGINVMQLKRELASVRENARPRSLGHLLVAGRSRTAVAIDALVVRASDPH